MGGLGIVINVIAPASQGIPDRPSRGQRRFPRGRRRRGHDGLVPGGCLKHDSCLSQYVKRLLQSLRLLLSLHDGHVTVLGTVNSSKRVGRVEATLGGLDNLVNDGVVVVDMVDAVIAGRCPRHRW